MEECCNLNNVYDVLSREGTLSFHEISFNALTSPPLLKSSHIPSTIPSVVCWNGATENRTNQIFLVKLYQIFMLKLYLFEQRFIFMVVLAEYIILKQIKIWVLCHCKPNLIKLKSVGKLRKLIWKIMNNNFDTSLCCAGIWQTCFFCVKHFLG